MNPFLLQQSLNAQNTPKIQVFPEIPPPKTFFLLRLWHCSATIDVIVIVYMYVIITAIVIE